MPRLFERVTIAGVGLIGGSLALAARAAGLIGEAIGYGRTEANLQVARRRGIVDRYSQDIVEAARDTDLLLLAVPVNAMAALVRACAPVLRAGAVVSDVGSVKARVVGEVEAVLPAAVSFVGAHPIAGSEHSGAAAAFAELFQGSRCIITRGRCAEPSAVAKIRALWEGVGMRVDEMDPAQHDQMLAWVSHLPHAVAFSAVNAVVDTDPAMQQFAGPSFRDLTRVAASSVEMWSDIFLANAAQMDTAIVKFAAVLEALRRAITSGDATELKRQLEHARTARQQWSRPSR
ncbi:MAG: prephenate dehydrogenase/arogenate dehydrogenase family protein [Candidatus Binatia bacterium]